MRTILATTALLSVLFLSCCSTCELATSDALKHVIVKSYPGKSKAFIVGKVQRWVARNFGSYKAAMDFADPSAGVVVMKGFIERFIQPTESSDVKSADAMAVTITADVQEERARFTLSHVIPMNGFFEMRNCSNCAEIHRDVQKHFEHLVAELDHDIESDSW